MYDRSTSIRLTNTIFISQSFLTASQIAIFTLLSIMAVELSGRESLTGIPSTVLTLTRAFVAVPIGYLMGRFGRRFGLTVSYGVSIFGAALGIVAITQGAFWILLASSALLGAGRAGAEQSRFAAGDLFPEHERGRMIGRVVFAGTLGAIFGPLLVIPGTWLAESVGMDANTGPWVIGTILYICATLIAFFLLRPEPMLIARQIAGEEKAKNTEPDQDARPIRQLLQLPAVQLAIFATLISQTVMVTLMVITPVHMNHHDHSNSAVSIVITAHTLGMFGLSSLTGYLIDRFGRVPMMVAGAIVLLASAVIAPFSPTMPFLVIGLFLLGLGWNFGYLAGSTLLSDALRGEERARMQGVNDMFVAGAAAFGSFISGPLFSVADYWGVAIAGISAVLLLVWLIVLLSPRAEFKKKNA